MAIERLSVLKHMGDRIVDAVFPRFCVRCEEEGSLLCERCFAQWHPGDAQIDEQVVALFPYSDPVTRDLIRSWKYHFDQTAFDVLKKKMQPRLHVLSLMARARGVQAIVPVPLHEGRLCERGFDQAKMFASLLEEEMGVPVLEALYREKSTEQQAEKDDVSRQAIVAQQPFFLVKEVPQSVMLVDDVYTTGATCQAAIEVLKAGGVKSVLVCTMARG